jgi:predicted transcriptional regulator
MVMESTFTFRVDSELKRAFELAAASQDRSGSQLLRDFMRDYAKKHAQADLIPVATTKQSKKR